MTTPRPLGRIAKLAARVAAYEELVRRGSTVHEQIAAQERAAALRRRLWEERAAEPFDWGVLHIPGSGGHGKARYDAMLLIADAYGCRKAFYGVGMSPKDPWGNFELRYGGPLSLVEQVAEVLPGFLEEIEAAAKDATRAYGEHIRSLPEEDHDPKWRPSMRRKFRREYMAAYARHLSWRILTGDRDRRAPVAPRPDSAHGQAELAAARSDLRGCLPTAHVYIPRAMEGRRQIHAPDYIRTIPTEEAPIE
ncbi:hypothetical protein AB0C10_16230 [Microbispora amethystogenes]|uniref:hypothetical protein n=1 Tax=Microbispora amethystogenes TaxID=1427754 RepID=UPI0033F1377B